MSDQDGKKKYLNTDIRLFMVTVKNKNSFFSLQRVKNVVRVIERTLFSSLIKIVYATKRVHININ